MKRSRTAFGLILPVKIMVGLLVVFTAYILIRSTINLVINLAHHPVTLEEILFIVFILPLMGWFTIMLLLYLITVRITVTKKGIFYNFISFTEYALWKNVEILGKKRSIREGYGYLRLLFPRVIYWRINKYLPWLKKTVNQDLKIPITLFSWALWGKELKEIINSRTPRMACVDRVLQNETSRTQLLGLFDETKMEMQNSGEGKPYLFLERGGDHFQKIYLSENAGKQLELAITPDATRYGIVYYAKVKVLGRVMPAILIEYGEKGEGFSRIFAQRFTEHPKIREIEFYGSILFMGGSINRIERRPQPNEVQWIEHRPQK